MNKYFWVQTQVNYYNLEFSTNSNDCSLLIILPELQASQTPRIFEVNGYSDTYIAALLSQ